MSDEVVPGVGEQVEVREDGLEGDRIGDEDYYSDRTVALQAEQWEPFEKSR